ncbi:hypothetical protein K3495_g427 [Podosphaera aphanis]|nr:hypothetical protein K3495_g427 [Podosphaera aphanis]
MSPRVVTYAKRNTNIIHYQERRISSTEQGIGDISFLSVKDPNNPRLLIINAYNASPGSTNPGAGVSSLSSIADVSLPHQAIPLGDLHLHHPMWHPTFRGSPSPPSEAFTRWIESCGLFLISEIDRLTYNRGSVLDLCFGSSQLVAKGTIATVQEDLDQFGALPKRSSVDLTTCLTYDVETALSKGLNATLATLDIKSAFDAVLPGRLVERLREQGWLAHLCNWTASFVTEREVCIRLDGEIGDPIALHCGIPQGSPISPILFMIFIAPLFIRTALKNDFGYADDVAVLRISPTLGENLSTTFDPSKSGLLHFSYKQRDKDLRPPAETNSFAISEDPLKPYLTWHGVHFDKKLTFKHHAKIQSTKALKVTHALRCLGNTIRGASPLLKFGKVYDINTLGLQSDELLSPRDLNTLRQAAFACALPIAHFGAETSWPGKSRINRGKVISNKVDSHLTLIEKVHNATARAILPIYHITPTASLFREAGINPAEIALDSTSRRAAIRTRGLDPQHPLYKRAIKSLTCPALSRFARSCHSISATEIQNPLLYPPWERVESRQATLACIRGCAGPRELRANSFQELLSTIPRSDIQIYSDGSKLLDGRSGGGFAVYQFDIQVCAGAFPLGKFKESFDAEARAVLQGIRAACFSNNLWVILDNEEVAGKLLKRTTTTSSQSFFLETLDAAKIWKSRLRLPHTSEG